MPLTNIGINQQRLQAGHNFLNSCLTLKWILVLPGQPTGSQSSCVSFRGHDRWTASFPVSVCHCVKRFLTSLAPCNS